MAHVRSSYTVLETVCGQAGAQGREEPAWQARTGGGAIQQGRASREETGRSFDDERVQQGRDATGLRRWPSNLEGHAPPDVGDQ